MRLGLLPVLLLTPAMFLTATADDWPQFRGPTRDGQCAEQGLLQRWPAGGPKQVWRASGLGAGYSSPAIVGGKVYVSGMADGVGTLRCLDGKGKLLWARKYGAEYGGGGFRGRGGNRFAGARTTPTVHDGRVYLMSAAGTVGCFDAASGDPVWSVDTVERFGAVKLKWGLSESLLIADGKLIVTPGGKGASLVALDLKSGETIWKSATLSHASAYCSPLLVTHDGVGMILTHTADAIVAVAPRDGSVLWQHPYRNMRAIHPVTPVLSGPHVFATSGYGHGAIVLRIGAGAKQVEQVWREKTMDTHHGGLVVIDGHVYGTSSNRPKARWMCIEVATGKVKYEAKGIGKGAVIAAGDKLYCYGEDGDVALVQASPEGWKELGRFKVEVGEQEHWAHPAISNGLLYIRHGSVLTAYDIRAGK